MTVIGTYRPTARVLVALELLQAHGQLSAADLAVRLEVDPRTVRRYVTTLQDIGIPVEGTRGSHGGYRLRPGFKLPPLMLSDDEALAVTLGLLQSRQLGAAGAGPAAASALAKVERVLPLALRERVAGLAASVEHVSEPRDRPRPTAATLLTLGDAVHARRGVWLRYRSARDAETEREVDPYGLVLHAGLWYLVGRDHLRSALRVFRTDRIAELQPRSETFERPTDFRALDHVARALATAPWRWDVEVVLRTTLDKARQMVAPWQATLEGSADGVVMHARAEQLRGMALWLVSLDCPFVVRRPPELRDELRRLASEIVAAVGQGE